MSTSKPVNIKFKLHRKVVEQLHRLFMLDGRSQEGIYAALGLLWRRQPDRSCERAQRAG